MQRRPEMCSLVDFICFPSKTEVGVIRMELDGPMFEFLSFLKKTVKTSVEQGSRVHLACSENSEGGWGIVHTRHALAENTRWHKCVLSSETAGSDLVRNMMHKLQHFEFKILKSVEWLLLDKMSPTTLQVFLTTDDAQENMLGSLLAVYDSDTESEGEDTPQQTPRPEPHGQTSREELTKKMQEKTNQAKCRQTSREELKNKMQEKTNQAKCRKGK